MPVIPNGWGIATCNFLGNNLPHGGAVVFGFQNVAVASANTCALNIHNAVGTQVDNLSSADVTFVSVDVKLGPNSTGAIGSFTGAGIVGATGSTSLSPGTTLLMEKATAFGGRRGRGRMFWPGVYDGWVDDTGALTSGVASTINTACASMLSDLTAAGVPMALLHTPSYTWEIVGGQPRRVYADPGTVPVPFLVSGLTADARVATQRRRLR